MVSEFPNTPTESLEVPADASPITAEQYRAAMRHYPTGVTVVTLRTDDGRPIGFTASSFASLSLDPPLISFNIAHSSSSIGALHACDSVVIHFLGEHQRHVAQRFARSADERFADDSLWTWLETGEPVLFGTPIWLRVTIHQLIAVGDHTLVIGLVHQVQDVTDTPTGAPLLYHDGKYHRPTPLDG